MNNITNTRKINQTIGNWLRMGVFLSVTTVIIGLMVTYIQDDFQVFLPQNDASNGNHFLRFYSLLIQGKGIGIITLGVLLMLATPVLRLLLALLLFFKEGDFLYVAITLLVMGILTWSLFLGS